MSIKSIDSSLVKLGWVVSKSNCLEIPKTKGAAVQGYNQRTFFTQVCKSCTSSCQESPREKTSHFGGFSASSLEGDDSLGLDSDVQLWPQRLIPFKIIIIHKHVTEITVQQEDD